MDEGPAHTLEVAVMDASRILLRLEKYRGIRPIHAALLTDALALGDRARKALRRAGPEPADIAALAEEGLRLRDRVAAALRAVEESPLYRQAVRAHESADLPALRRLLPVLFADLEPVDDVREAYASLPWLRRGRPRPPRELAAVITRIAAQGLAAEGPPEAAGCDPSLPAITLAADPPDDSPVTLRFRGSDLPLAWFRLQWSGNLLLHVRRLRAPFEVHFADSPDPHTSDEVLLEWPAYRALLEVALADFAGRPST